MFIVTTAGISPWTQCLMSYSAILPPTTFCNLPPPRCDESWLYLIGPPSSSNKGWGARLFFVGLPNHHRPRDNSEGSLFGQRLLHPSRRVVRVQGLVRLEDEGDLRV